MKEPASIKQREGHLAPCRNSEVRWIVEGKSAFSVHDNGRVEIFKARSFSSCKCGYKFIFVFNFTDWNNTVIGLRLLSTYGGEKRASFCRETAISIIKKHPKNLIKQQPIDTSYTLEAQEKVKSLWEEKNGRR